MTKNITLAIEEDVLTDVRRYAAEHNTTVNALVRASLLAIAERARRQQREWDALFALTDAAADPHADEPSGGRARSRDDGQDRP